MRDPIQPHGRKILPLEEIASVVAESQRRGLTVVHCHGVFDLVHPGHVRHLAAARALGDALVVTVTPDHFVNKGPGRPVFSESLRAESLAALEVVDYVGINRWPTAVETIGLIGADVYVKGGDYEDPADDTTGMILEERRAVEEGGGRVEFTNDEVTFSSSSLLNAHFDVFSPEAGEFLASFRRRHDADEILGLLGSLADMHVVVVGDAIIDEYHFCRPYGKASKSTAIAAQFLREERHLGGALALANHLAGYVGRVTLISALGDGDLHEATIRAGLNPNVEPLFVRRGGCPTVTKRRYVDPYLVQKLFEVAFFNDTPLPAQAEEQAAAAVSAACAGADLAVVADFGNGFIGPSIIEALTESECFLAVNAQANAINLGFNVVTKYPRADYVCVDREEALLAVRDRHAVLEEVIERLQEALGARYITITRGSEGAIVRGLDRTVHVPPLTREVVDTTGAGDAFLAITAPLARLDVDPEIVGFVGNAVGTLAVRIVGNRESVDSASLYRIITTLLK